MSESALLSLWAKLGDYQEDIVLIGGLVPRYLCLPRADGLEPATLDVDFGIALAAGGSIYLPLSERLASEGFLWEKGRFVKRTSRGNLFVDFLTERPTANSTITAVVDDIGVSAFFGIDRALKICRNVKIEGRSAAWIDSGRRADRHLVVLGDAGPKLIAKAIAYRRRG